MRRWAGDEDWCLHVRTKTENSTFEAILDTRLDACIPSSYDIIYGNDVLILAYLIHRIIY